MLNIIATAPEDDERLAEAAELLRNNMGIHAGTIPYRDSFGGTHWSVTDLENTEARDRPEDKKLRFMEFAEEQIQDDAVERGWDSINSLLTEFEDDDGDE